MGAPMTGAIEGVGGNYSQEGMLAARDHTRAAIQAIAAMIQPGMLEEDAIAAAREMLRERGLLRGWHGLLIRFGSNTLKDFAEPSEPNVRLGGDDIFFIDIGPVWEKWEGDGGETFVVGRDPDMLAARDAVRDIFERMRRRWLDERLSGKELYAAADAYARTTGWILNLDMSGHRLSDFPHSVHHKGGLGAAEITPQGGLWVLEIQIRHPTRPFGAFFEDLLLEA